MNKKLFFIGAIAILALLVSCREEDKHLLDKGFRLDGELDPALELPISYGQVNFGELLSKLGDGASDYLTDDEIITLAYTFDTLGYVNVGNSAPSSAPSPIHKPSIPTKDQEFTPMEDTVITIEFPLSFFDYVDMLSENKIWIEELLVSGYANIWADYDDDPIVKNNLQYIHADIDQLKIGHTKHDGQEAEPIMINGAELHITDLSDPNNQLPIAETNLRDIFNDMSSYISISFHIVISVDEDGLTGANLSDLDGFSDLLDRLGMLRLAYKTHVDVRFPLEIQVEALTYNYDIDLHQSDVDAGNSVFDQIDETLNNLLGEDAANIDSATLSVVLRLNNGIPLDIIMNAIALDANGNEIFSLIDGDVIASAQTSPVPNVTGVSQASASTPTEIVANLNLAQARQFVSASTLRIKLGLHTTGNDSKAVRRSDFLGINMFIRLNPNIKFNWDIPGLENGIGGFLPF